VKRFRFYDEAKRTAQLVRGGSLAARLRFTKT
jgi:hypothetical protein